jgi:hypothetical protein
LEGRRLPHSQSHSPGGPEPPFPLLLLLEWVVFAVFAEDWLRLRRDEAAETTGAHTSASKQMATNAEVVRVIVQNKCQLWIWGSTNDRAGTGFMPEECAVQKALLGALMTLNTTWPCCPAGVRHAMGFPAQMPHWKVTVACRSTKRDSLFSCVVRFLVLQDSEAAETAVCLAKQSLFSITAH